MSHVYSQYNPKCTCAIFSRFSAGFNGDSVRRIRVSYGTILSPSLNTRFQILSMASQSVIVPLTIGGVESKLPMTPSGSIAGKIECGTFSPENPHLIHPLPLSITTAGAVWIPILIRQNYPVATAHTSLNPGKDARSTQTNEFGSLLSSDIIITY